VLGSMGFSGLRIGFGASAALPHLLCRPRLERENDGAQQIGGGTGRSKRDADAGGAFHDAGSNLEQPQAQGGELGSRQSGGLRDRLLDASQQPVGSGVQDQAHLIGIGRAARSAVTGQLGLVQLDCSASITMSGRASTRRRGQIG